MNARGSSGEAQTTMRRLLHEVRTPLGQILGYGEMLEEEALERGQHDLVPDLRRIRAAAQRVLGIVDGLFGAEIEMPVADSREGIARTPLAPTTAPARLLVVDDEEANRDLFARQLERRGYAVSVAVDGREALHKIEREPFDLILLDGVMPGMSGFEVLEAIRRTRGPAELPVVMVTALDGRDDVVRALGLGANDYVTKPLDLAIALARIESHLTLRRITERAERLARQLELHGAFLRRTFGRYLSDEVVADLLTRPEALDLRGEKREISVLVADLRGFSSLVESLSPVQVMALLNHYLGTMAEVIHAHGGTVDEFLGDAILAFFGAPAALPEHARSAVTCAIEMQLAMPAVNAQNRAQSLPEVEMGIAVATGDVIVGNIGSERRSKYGAIGTAVNLASRIESYTLGGEVLISDSARIGAGSGLRVDPAREVHPKGFDAPLRVYRVIGFAAREGSGERALERDSVELVELDSPWPVRIAVLEGKRVGERSAAGRIESLSAGAARIRCELSVTDLADLRVELLDETGHALEACYAKVVLQSSGDGHGVLLVRFTTRAARISEWVRSNQV